MQNIIYKMDTYFLKQKHFLLVLYFSLFNNKFMRILKFRHVFKLTYFKQYLRL